MGEKFKVLLSKEEISKRIQVLGKEVSAHYQREKTESLVVLGILKGSFIFTADFVRALDIPCEIDFIEASSYGAGTTSSGEVKILRDTSVPLKGRDIILVEDIVDTGLTISRLLAHLKVHEPKSIKVCSLLDKPSRRKTKVDVDFLGFTIDDHFVIGYGLDYNNRYREIPEVVIYDGPVDAH